MKLMDRHQEAGENLSRHPEDLLAPYALDALNEDEREAVLAHLASCAICREAVAQYRQVTEVLPLAEPPSAPPGPDLRARIVQGAGRTPQLGPRREASVRLRPRFSLVRLGGWLAAAALFLISLGLGVWDYSLHQQLQAARQPALAYALAATPDAPGAAGRLLLGADHSGVLSVENLQPPASGEVYEAWVIGSAGPAPAGTFVTTPEGHGALILTRPPAPGEIVAITNEPAPGVPKPTGKILLKGTV